MRTRSVFLFIAFIMVCCSKDEPNNYDTVEKGFEYVDNTTLKSFNIHVHENEYGYVDYSRLVNETDECLSWKEQNEKYLYSEKEYDNSTIRDWYISYDNCTEYDILQSVFKIVNWTMPLYKGLSPSDEYIVVLDDGVSRTREYRKAYTVSDNVKFSSLRAPVFSSNYYISFSVELTDENKENIEKWLLQNKATIKLIEAVGTPYGGRYEFSAEINKINADMFERLRSFASYGDVRIFRKGFDICETYPHDIK